MPPRRYGEDEVREIFAVATTGSTAERALPAESGGLTLDELRVIAKESGIDPALVAQAAASLDARGKVAPVKRMLGMPVGLARVVDLPRAPTDREWEKLISEFRTTFDGLGVATSTGGLRVWSHGSLHISVEPSEHGEQLRITSRNELAMALNGLGIVMGGMSLLMGTVVTLGGKPEKALAVLAMFGGISIVSFAANVLRLPRWAREHSQQMEEIAERAVKLLSSEK